LKVRIKLYGTLPKYYSDYDLTSEMEINIPEDSRVRDLIEIMGNSRTTIGMVVIDGKLAKAGDRITEGAEVKFFQPISGG
jgi:sulfur carrier protein ThiS